MSVDIQALLTLPAGEAKAPEPLPDGNYSGVVSKYEYGKSQKKETPYVRYYMSLNGPLDDIQIDPSVDLSKREFRTEFYLTHDSLYRVDEFLRSCGIALEARTYAECLPEVIGQPVIVQMKQVAVTRNDRQVMISNVENIRGTNQD